MFVHLVVSTLILGSVVAVPPLAVPLTNPPTTGGPTHELSSSSLQMVKNPAERQNETSADAMTNFRCTFMDYEEHVKLFMDNLKFDGQPLKNATSRKLFEEMRPYIALLPKVEGRLVTKKYREKCWCDGSMSSPCPEKCMNSCRWFTDSPTFPWKNENDCEGAKSTMTSCYCYEGSSTRCNYGNLSNCYDGERSEVIEQVTNTTCSLHGIDENILEKTLPTFFNSFLEPLREQLRRFAYKLSSFKRAVMASDSLFNVTYASCCEKRNEAQCYPEASDVLNEKLSEFVEIKKNITMDMNRLQENAAWVSNDLKRTAVFQFQAKIKEYKCCLKGLDYSFKDSECKAPASSHSTLPSPPSPTTS